MTHDTPPYVPQQCCPAASKCLSDFAIADFLSRNPPFRDPYVKAYWLMQAEHILYMNAPSGVTEAQALEQSAHQFSAACAAFTRDTQPSDTVVQIDGATAFGIINATIRKMKSQKALAAKAGLTPQEVSNALNRREGRRIKPALYKACGVLTGDVFFTKRGNVPPSGKIIP